LEIRQLDSHRTKKLYLFDIDGTLLSPGPSARKALNTAIENKTGHPANLQIADVAGLTDQLIIRNVLNNLEFNGDIEHKAKEILGEYLNLFRAAYAESTLPFIFKDAIKLLERIEESGNAIALLTGNARIGAQIKLGKFDLWERFTFGVYGDDGITRTDLPAVAQKRARDVLDIEFSMKNMVIIGDTPNDARTAQVNGCESIIVCRRSEWYAEIQQYQPTVLVNTLDDDQIIIPIHEVTV
jgi:phosphoglycolate phosphatase-like HAD superfamily hydrolase